MARNGSGAYSLPAGNPVVTGTTISSTVQNSTMTDIGTALTQSLAYDGQTNPVANLPMAGFKHTGVANAAARTDYAAAGQVQDSSLMWAGTAGGTANALTLTLSPAITAIAAGQRFAFKSGASPNSAATTVAISGLTAIAAQVNGAACAGGEIAASKWYEIVVDASLTSCQLHKLGRATLAELGISTFAQTFLDDADASAVLSTLGFSTFAKTIIDDVDAAAMRTTLGISAGLYFDGVSSATVTTTWTKATSAGKYIYINNAGATTQTLPLASTFSSGQAIAFFNFGAGAATISRQGSDALIGTVSASSFLLNQNESVILVTDGSSWFCNFLNGATGLAPQTWQDVLASRTIGVAVPNNTGRPIKVAISSNNANVAFAYWTASVAGSTLIYSSQAPAVGGVMSLYFEVPNGASYTVTHGNGATTPTIWKEDK